VAKKIDGYIKLQIAAGQAKPSPPIGPALGQRGVNIMGFCKEFNAATQGVEPGTPLPTVITVYSDKSFTFELKTPPTSILLMKAAGADKGSARPNKDKIGKLTSKVIREIAEKKLVDLNTDDLDAAIRTVRGTARSMGIEIVD